MSDGAAESELSLDAGALVDAVAEEDGDDDGELGVTGDCESAVG